MAQTYTATRTFTRIMLLKVQIRSALRRLTNETPEKLDQLMLGIDKRWIRSFSVYAFNRDKICRGELTLEIDWDEHEAQLAIGRTTVAIDKRWIDDTAIEVDEAIRIFQELSKNFHWRQNGASTILRKFMQMRENSRKSREHWGLLMLSQ